MCTSLRRLTKSACRSPRAWPMRMPVSASNANKNRSRARSAAANTTTTSSALSVRGVAARNNQLDRPRRDRPALADVVQERLVRTAADAPPRHQAGGDLDTRAGVMLVEAEHRGQMAVHRRRRTHPDTSRRARRRCPPAPAATTRTGRRRRRSPPSTPARRGPRTRTTTSSSARKPAGCSASAPTRPGSSGRTRPAR